MTNLKNRFRFLETSVLQITGLFLMFLVAILLLWKGNANSNQAVSAMLAQVYFEGEYRVGEGEWQEIIEGQHIPATKGDVTLRGNFHMLTPDGEYVGPLEPNIPMALFMDHINATIFQLQYDSNFIFLPSVTTLTAPLSFVTSTSLPTTFSLCKVSSWGCP